MIIKDNRKVALSVTNTGAPSDLIVLHPGGRKETMSIPAPGKTVFWLPVGSYFAFSASGSVLTVGALIDDVKVTGFDSSGLTYYILKDGVNYSARL